MLNKIILMGRLVRDPELRHTQSGVAVASLRIACNRDYKSKDPNAQNADFINIVVWRGQADNCYKYLKKGSKAGVVGTLQTRAYDGNDGTRKYATEVVAEEVEFLASKGAVNGEETEAPAAGSKSTGKSDVVNKFEPIDDDNLPF